MPVEGQLKACENRVEVLFENGEIKQLQAGDEFEVLVFTALIRFEWITVRLVKNDDGYGLMSPNSRSIVLKNISKVRM